MKVINVYETIVGKVVVAVDTDAVTTIKAP